MLTELNDKKANVEKIAQKAVLDKELITELLQGLKSRNETVRYNCSKTLMIISRERGELLYPSWAYLVEFLDSENSYQKMAAVNLLANLVKFDTENRFEQLLKNYFDLLDDKSMILGIYVASNAGKIVNSKPQLEKQITKLLLDIDNTHHSGDRKELIKAGAIEAFLQYFPLSENKEKILKFVSEQQASSSPKTRKLAKQFLKTCAQDK
jgi:hypothetical protein